MPREQARDLLANAVQDEGQAWVDAIRADLNSAIEKAKADRVGTP